MAVWQRGRGGELTPAEPLPMTPGIEFEVHSDGSWHMYVGKRLSASGRNRTRIGRGIAMWRAKRSEERDKRVVKLSPLPQDEKINEEDDR